jgi:hypothetical protein
MKFTIIPVDLTAVKDGVGYPDLDLSSAGIPANVHALQWQDTAGIVEYTDLTQETITVLPDWAARVLAVWQAADDVAKAPPPDPTPEELTAARIAELKQLLADTDYVALSDYDKDKADVIAQRQAWRTEIRELEA